MGKTTRDLPVSDAHYKAIRHMAAIKSWRTRKRNAAKVKTETYRDGAVQMGGDWAREFSVDFQLSTSPSAGAKRGGGGMSETYHMTLKNGMKGNFKPESGAAKGLRNGVKDGMQSERELAAWEVAKLVGMDDMVAPASIRTENVPGYNIYPAGKKKGVLLLWQDGTPANELSEFDFDEDIYGYRDAKRPTQSGGLRKLIDSTAEARIAEADRNLQRAAMFDFIIGNQDRHAGNWVVDDDDGSVKLIDHGLSFGEGSIGNRKRYGNCLMLRYATQRDRDGLFVDKSAKPRDFAAPYVKRKGEILKMMADLGFEENAVRRVGRRIDLAAEAETWEDISYSPT